MIGFNYVYGFISILCSCRTSKDNTSTESPEWWETETVDTAGAQDETQDEDDKIRPYMIRIPPREGFGTEGTDCGDDLIRMNLVSEIGAQHCVCMKVLLVVENNVWLSDEDK